jgi:hypothetical protein
MINSNKKNMQLVDKTANRVTYHGKRIWEICLSKKKAVKLYWFLLYFVIAVFGSCKKLVDAPPPTDFITGSNTYSTDATAIAVLNGIYIGMSQASGGPDKIFQGNFGIAVMTGMSGDEFTLYNGATGFTYLGYFKNELSQNLGAPGSGAEYWPVLYNYIFKCNAAIEGLTKTNSLTPAIKKQLLGEAKFLRGFFYFYLVNFFGDVPLVLGTDPEVNALLTRSTKTKVYDQIIADLVDAEEKLSDPYLNETLLSTTNEKVRPTKWAATAMLARVYLYKGDFAKAEAKSTLVINNRNLFGPLPSLADAFLKNSPEALWQIQPTDVEYNTMEARTLVLPTSGPNTNTNPVFLSNSLLNSFEAGDMRAVDGNWIKSITVGSETYWYPFKYKINLSPGVTDAASMTEYFMVLRLGEQYLIRAEARARLGNLGAAIDDLDMIRTRAGLPTIGTTNPGISQSELIDKILHERQVELFSELGHRWFDLKRTGKVDEVMNIETSIKSNGATQWQSYQQLYPLPLTELQRAKNLVQNPGYN